MTPDEQGNPALEEKLHEAHACLVNGDFDGAENLLRDVAKTWPDSPLPHHNMSVLYLERLRRDYDHLETWEDLSDDEAWFDAAVKAAERALECDPEFIAAHNNLGLLCGLKGWWGDALKHWEHSLSIDGDQSQVRERMLEARKHAD